MWQLPPHPSPRTVKSPKKVTTSELRKRKDQRERTQQPTLPLALDTTILSEAIRSSNTESNIAQVQGRRHV